MDSGEHEPFCRTADLVSAKSVQGGDGCGPMEHKQRYVETLTGSWFPGTTGETEYGGTSVGSKWCDPSPRAETGAVCLLFGINITVVSPCHFLRGPPRPRLTTGGTEPGVGESSGSPRPTSARWGRGHRRPVLRKQV